MKKTLFFGLILVLFSPFLASAEAAAPYARYCPDPADIFTGVASESEYTPKITVKVDPDFNAKMRAERSMGDLPLTPVYNLVVTVVPTINEYCLPQYDENGTKIRDADPPQLFPFSTSLVVGDSVTADSTLVVGILKRAGRTPSTGEWRYEWKVTGWPSGIVSEAKMEKLIDAIAKNQPVNVIVEVKRPGTDTVYEKYTVLFNNCAPMWGNGQHKIVGMYDEGKDASQVVDYFDEVRKIGFTKIEPYASNQSFFSYFVDLKWVFGGSIKPLAQIALDAKNAKLRAPTISSQRNTLAKYINASSCKDGIYLLKVKTQNNSLPWGIGGIAILGGSVRGALIDTEGAQLVAGSRGASDVGIVYVHEFSHTFAKLNDEYVYRAQSVNIGLPLRNCSVRPLVDFSVNGVLFGSARYQGCSFQYDAGDKPSVPSARYYRPSDKSVMNKDGDGFNVVSCGWILAAIKGGDAKSYFPECANMSGIIKDGVRQSASVLDGFSSIFSLLNFSSVSLTAEAGAALQVGAGKPVKVIVPESRTPPAELQALAKGEKIAKPEVCLDASGKRTFDDSPQPFRADWASQAKCAQGVADATVLLKKIGDLKASIAIVQNFIDSLSLSVEETKNLTTLDGASFFIIPAGEQQEKTYERVGGIALQCVSGATIPVGMSGISKGTTYTKTSSALQAQTEAAKQKIQKSNDAYLKESPKDRGTVISSTLDRLSALQDTLKGNFVLVTTNALSTYHPAAILAGTVLPLSVKLELGADGAEKKCAIGKWAGIKLAVDGREITAAGDFLLSTISFNGSVFEHDCIPQVYLLKELKTGLSKNLAYFEKKKAEYRVLLTQTEQQLTTLESVGYGCATLPSGGEVAQTSQPVRKSGTTPADRHAQANTTPTSSSGEPSYLIVESFDPNNPWGEIISIVPDNFATSTATSTFMPTFQTEPGHAASSEQGRRDDTPTAFAIPCGAPITSTVTTPPPIKAPESSGFGYSGDGASFNYDATNYQTANDSSLITLQAGGGTLSWTTWKDAYICHLNGVYVPVVGSHKLASHTESCSYTLACTDAAEKTNATKSVTVLAK